MQLTAAWVRRKRFEAGLLAQALLIGQGLARPATKAKGSRDEFFDALIAASSQVVTVEAGGNGGEAG